MMEKTSYVQKKYIKKDTVELRDYQKHLAMYAKDKNTMVVLPTGLGKTVVALHIIADHLENKQTPVLFLAPTRVLVGQHQNFLLANTTIADIIMITGESTIEKRRKQWDANSIVCATPEITRNDLARGIVTAQKFGLVIFDEAHRTIGDYAYAQIAELLAPNTRIVGMTATLPSENIKAKEIMDTLHIQEVAFRDEQSSDVKPYIQKTNTEWIKVDLPREVETVRVLVKRALQARYDALQRCGVMVDGTSLSALLRQRPYVLYKNRKGAKPLFMAIRITYALNILEAHGITPFLKFCERSMKKPGIKTKELFENDPDFVPAMARAREAQEKGIEHSKIPKLIELLSNLKGKALIFSSYRDSVDMIRENLKSAGIDSGMLIGKAGKDGLKQKKQIEAVEKFREGEYNVLVSTRVGEEGLDISEVNLVVLYDNVPSSIRFVQRRGRTGRKDTGRLVVLIANKTIDEAYYWIGQRKIKQAGSMGEKMVKHVEKNPSPNVLDAYV